MTVPGRSKHQFEESALTAGKQDFKQQKQNRNPSPQKKPAAAASEYTPQPLSHPFLGDTARSLRYKHPPLSQPRPPELPPDGAAAPNSLTPARARTEPDTTERRRRHRGGKAAWRAGRRARRHPRPAEDGWSGGNGPARAAAGGSSVSAARHNRPPDSALPRGAVSQCAWPGPPR